MGNATATAERTRGRGRPVSNATATFVLKSVEGAITVKVVASGKSEKAIANVERVANAMRNTVSKNVKGISVNGTPTVQF